MANNDLISRSALVENYEQFLARASIDPIIRAFMVSILCTVENAPAVDAEVVRHGTWLYGTEYAGAHEVDCSVCGDSAKEYFDYCPNCGAKMDAEVEG